MSKSDDLEDIFKAMEEIDLLSEKRKKDKEILILDKDNQSFMLSTLQDAGAVVVYNITDPLNPVYDSGAISELNDYTQQDGGVSSGEPEGLHYKDGFVLVANTADPSVALFKASWVD